MEVREAISWSEKELIIKGIADFQSSVEILLSSALGEKRSTLHLYPNRRLTKEEESSFRQMIKKRKQFCPTAYILGETDFYYSTFLVDQNVLIPRPETELLVEKVREHLLAEKRNKVSILDVGTGSGAIIISLAKIVSELNIKATLKASDISPKALKIAQKNAAKILANRKIRFFESDLLAVFHHQHFDLITANLPSIQSKEISLLAPDLKHEPKLALDGGRDGLVIYRRFIKELNSLIGPTTVFCEITKGQKESLIKLTERYLRGATIEICQDYAKIDRIAIIKIS